MEQLLQAATSGVPGARFNAHAPQPGDYTLSKTGHRVELFARAKLPTRHGEFSIFAFKNSKENLDHVAVVKGDVWEHDEVPMRLHSECLTGDVFGSLKCDCREQLEKALEHLSTLDRAVILYMRQEGRGIGLANKIRAYSLQDQGMDTVEANKHLGFDDDLREYDIAAEMLKLLRPRSVVLMTNNPKKIQGLVNNGIDVVARQPIQIVPNKHNLHYLKTKRTKSGHVLTLI